MGWAVLYLAFAVVALWLLGEVLLQYKARLRWRLLAFVGFLGVVLGVLLPSVPVIALGAIAFATGQALVTLSFRRGFSTGWALGGKPGASKRRRGKSTGPSLEVSDLRLEDEGTGHPGPLPEPAAESTALLEQVPSGEEAAGRSAATTASYDPVHGDISSWTATPGGYETASFATASPFGESFAAGAQDGATGSYAQTPYGSYDTGTYPGGGYDSSGYGTDYAQTTTPAPVADGAGTWGGQQSGYGHDYAQDYSQQSYPAYADPYAGGGTDGYGAQGYGQPRPGWEQYPAAGGSDGYGYPMATGLGPEATYVVDTPPGGVWVPQQRTSEGAPLPPYAPEGPYGGSEGQGSRY